MSSWKYFYRFVKKYQLLLWISIFFSLIYSFVSAIFLGLIQPLFDKIIFFSSNNKLPTNLANKGKFVSLLLEYINKLVDFTDPIKGLILIGSIILLIGFIKGLFYFFQYFLSSLAGQLTVRDLRQNIYEHLWTLNLEHFSSERTGALLSQFTYNINSIESATSKGLRDLFINIFQIIVYLVILFGLDTKLTLVVLVCTPIILLPIVKLGNRMRNLTKNIQDKMADLTVVLQETITGIKVVRAFNMEEHELNKFKNENEKYLEVVKKIAKVAALDVPTIETLFTLIAVGILGYGGLRILEGHLTSGEFFMYFATLLSITPRFGVLSRVWGIFQAGLAGMDKVAILLEKKPDVQNIHEGIKHDLETEISFKNVSFGYTPDNLILKNINLSIKKGEFIAIVGPSGTGKTTLVDLLPRFYKITQGKIEIDGINIDKISLYSLRKQIGIITQDTFLFHDTIENNIRYSKPEATFDEIENAAKKAYAMNYICKLSSGFQTIVGERGAQLSGGERQRLSIARVILKNPAILILDEATSALDYESEQEVQKALTTLFASRTTIVIAHRLSTIKHADRIIVMDKGTIQEIGTHDELLEKSPLYRNLYELQFIK